MGGLLFLQATSETLGIAVEHATCKNTTPYYHYAHTTNSRSARFQEPESFFNYGEFATIRNNAGLNNFKISGKEFVERTGAICLQATQSFGNEALFFLCPLFGS